MTVGMDDIMGLVRAGRLRKATDAIQRGLGRTPQGAADGAMRDVTPRPAPLPGVGGDRPATKAPRPTARAKPRVRAKAKPPRARGGPALAPGARWEAGAGPLPHRLYVPSAPRADAPFLVMLHGCTQTPEDFAIGTGMCAAADRLGAHVLWPEQTRAANANGCWNWFEPAHQGGGEAAAIATLARRTAHERGLVGGVHAAGLSAGGAMAAILGARHADVFDGVGIHSGLAVGAARDVPSAFAAMRAGAAAGTPLAVPAIVFHGDADRTVAPVNAGHVAGTGGTGGTEVHGGRRVRIVRRPGTAGAPALEWWQVEGLGHAWSGGDPAGSYADPAGPDATAEMLRFFRAIAPRC